MDLLPGASERAKRLHKILVDAGVFDTGLRVVETLEPEYDDFTKFKLARISLRLLSFELWTHKTKPEELRLHHGRGIDHSLRHELGSIAGARLSPMVGVNYTGDLGRAAASISHVLRHWSLKGLAGRSVVDPPR